MADKNSETLCASCKKRESTLSCGLCEAQLCKSCVQFLEAEDFSFLKKIPKDLSHKIYCNPCYDEKVVEPLAEYQATMEKAKNVSVFFISQRVRIPLVSRSKEKLTVKDCPDRDETILRLAFFAAERNCNAVFDVDVTSVKIRNESYQKQSWSGSGFPGVIDESRMERQDARDE